MIRRILSLLATAAAAQLSAAQTPAPPATSQPAPIHGPTSLAAEPGLPRTPDGRPDFQKAIWAVNFFPAWEASPMAATLVVSEADAKKMVDTMVAGFLARPDENIKIDPEAEDIFTGTDGLPIVRGERRSRLLVLPADGKLPITPEERKAAAVFDPLAGGLESYEARPAGDRCLVGMGQPPLSMTLPFTRLRFIQTRDHVVVHTEMSDEIRIVPFAAAHKPKAHWSRWMGDSIARWEGDTLVIETTGLPQEVRVRGFPKIVVDPTATVIERFTRLSKDELLYQWTVIDPNVYTAPWLAEFSFFAANTGMFPSPCHEHNHSLTNILLGGRMAEVRGAAPKP